MNTAQLHSQTFNDTMQLSALKEQNAELLKALQLARQQMQQTGVIFTGYVTETIDAAIARVESK